MNKNIQIVLATSVLSVVASSALPNQNVNTQLGVNLTTAMDSLVSTTVTNSLVDTTTVNIDDVAQKHSVITQSIIISFYSIIFLLGISGNSLVVFVVCRNKAMQSVTNVFITNLALSDILMCLLAVPFTPLSFFSDNWIFGKFLCHLVPFSLGVSVYVSTLTSLAIAIDRYFVIVHPFKPRMKLGVCVLLIAVVWIVAVSISLPLAIYVKYNTTQTVTTCKELWPIPMLKRFFDLASLVLQYIIPFTVITYSYTKVWIILSKRTRPGKTKEKEQIELKRKKRTNRMLVAMVIIFAGCWMPLNIVHQIMEFKKDFTQNPHFSSVFFVAHVIAMSSTIYNPFLYAWLNDNFRKEFRLVIPCLFTMLKWCRTLRRGGSENQNDDEDDDNEIKDFNSKVMTRASFVMTNRTSLGITQLESCHANSSRNSCCDNVNSTMGSAAQRLNHFNGSPLLSLNTTATIATTSKIPHDVPNKSLNQYENNALHTKLKINNHTANGEPRQNGTKETNTKQDVNENDALLETTIEMSKQNGTANKIEIDHKYECTSL